MNGEAEMGKGAGMRNRYAAWAICLLFASCGGGSGGDDEGGTGSYAEFLLFKGVLQTAPSVSVHVLRETGAAGRLLWQGQTDANGRVFAEFSGYDGPVVARAWGGLFESFSGSTFSIPEDTPLMGIGDAGGNAFGLHLGTHWQWALTQEYARDPDLPLAKARDCASIDLARILGTTPSAVIDPVVGNPALEALVPGPGADMVFAIMGQCELAAALTMEVAALMDLMGEDLRDRKLDGLYRNLALEDGGTTLPGDLWQTSLRGAILDFTASGFNQSGLTGTELNVDDTLLAQPIDFPTLPFIRRIDRPWLVRGSTAQFDVYGTWSDLGSVQFYLGTEMIDPGAVTDNGVGGASFALDDTWIESFFDVNDRYLDFWYRDTVTGYEAWGLDALYFADPGQTPNVRRTDLQYGSTGGGEILRIVADDVTDQTQVNEVGGGPLVVDGDPTGRTVRVVLNPGAEGQVFLELINPGGTATIEYERKAGSSITSHTPTDLDDKISIGWQFYEDAGSGLNLKLHAGYLNYTSDEEGEGTLDRIAVSDLIPAPTIGTLDVQSFRARKGHENTELLIGTDFNWFSKTHRGRTFEVGLGPNGLTAILDAEPAQTGTDIAKLYGFKLVSMDLLAGLVEQGYGLMEMDAGGRGSLNIETTTRPLTGTVRTPGRITMGFSWQYDLDQRIEIVPDDTDEEDFDLRAYLSSSGLGFMYGKLGDAVVFGTAAPYSRNESAALAMGAWRGAKVSYPVKDLGIGPRIQFQYAAEDALAATTPTGLTYRFVGTDGVKLQAGDVTSTFLLNTRIRQTSVGPSGAKRRGDGTILGLTSCPGKIDLSSRSSDLALRTRAPEYTTSYSLCGPLSKVYYAFLDRVTLSDGSVPNEESVETYEGSWTFDRSTFPQFDGTDFRLGARLEWNTGSTLNTTGRNAAGTAFSSTDTDIDPGALLAVLPISRRLWFLGYGRYDTGGFFGDIEADDETVLGLGDLDPSRQRIDFTNYGWGHSLRASAVPQVDNGTSTSGTYNGVGLDTQFSGADGDRILIRWDTQLQLNGDGTASQFGSGTLRDEDGTTTPVALSFPGTYSLSMSRLVFSRDDGRTLVGHLTDDGESLNMRDMTPGLSTATFGYVQQATSAPDLGNQRLHYFNYWYPSGPMVTPPEIRLSMSGFDLSFAATSQIEDTGFSWTQDNKNPGLVSLGQRFATADYSVDGIGTLQFQLSSDNFSGYASDGGWTATTKDDTTYLGVMLGYKF